ncbi:MAG: hypothetical protein HQL31_05965, partial [Planctomycetes bacterium]|nr:hypothetical protein [Planctomycetota bacterium]
KDLRVSAWKRDGKCMVLLVNIGADRLEAAVKLDRKAMGLSEGAPDDLKIREADPELIQYFEEDRTTVEAPKVGEAMESLGGLSLELREEDLPPEERRARDPDGKFTWKGGILTCPVRRHDYRRFVFTQQ